jgi:hypothetical protein
LVTLIFAIEVRPYLECSCERGNETVPVRPYSIVSKPAKADWLGSRVTLCGGPGDRASRYRRGLKLRAIDGPANPGSPLEISREDSKVPLTRLFCLRNSLIRVIDGDRE